ncbi:ABC transporter permease [Micromonospora polyrhachis]|uniref:Putative ABC transport system permease protein n=1 Tax=Micromonospora polyrhachis TaxID=1282883 RepID=A0A7W7WRC4_9ACTN|nr:FtsX-like permease family protein [Micromonospora polyrhachis]MBB4960935.1 putative ABC transport system permease protein [Micromonospora polyrhachis]
MSAVGLVLRAGVRKRRVQTIVIGLATLMAVTASVLGGALLVVSSAPFDTAFTQQNGAHLSATFDPALVTPDQLTSSQADGVTATAGPYPTVTVTVTPQIGGAGSLPLNLVGRDTPNATVDQLTLAEGEWADAPGEVVLSASDWFEPLGMKLVLADLPGSPTLTVVGTTRSASQTADGWVSSAQVSALTGSGGPDGYQMLYRLATPDTTTTIDAARTAVSAGLPAKAMVGSQSWLDVKRVAEQETAIYVPFLMAFGILGLVMSVLIVGNVVAAAVGSGTHRIGVLKAVGFTPAQVMRTYLGQVLVPAAVGTAVGMLAGHLLAIPILAETSDAYGSATLTVPLWIDVVVAAGVLGLVAVTAWAASWRAGRLRTIDALAVGRTPQAGRGQTIARLTARLPLSRPITLGLARPFARPVRTLSMIVAVVFGATAVTFAVGLAASLNEVLVARRHNTADVTVAAIPPAVGPDGRPDGPPPKLPADSSAITAAIHAQPGTKYSLASASVTVAGMSGITKLNAFTGDARRGGYRMIEGEWFDAPGEAVAPTGFLTTTGRKIGDSVTLNVGGQHVTLRLVGEVFDITNDGMSIYTDANNLTTPVPVTIIKISLTPGTDTTAYANALEPALQPLGATTNASTAVGGDMIVVLNGLTAILTLMLVTVAGLGVLNTVLLDTRERVRDIGIHKAIGMTPRQTITSVLSSVAVNGLIGGASGVAAGMIMHRAVVPAMGDAAGLRLPQIALDVYAAPTVALLGLGGLVIALAGALPPAAWAARIRTTTALRAE